jgi:hypothetical protein
MRLYSSSFARAVRPMKKSKGANRKNRRPNTASAKTSKDVRRRANLIGKRKGAFTVLIAAPTTSVTIQRSIGEGGVLSAKLNRKALVFHDDRSHAAVSKGQTNTVEWLVVGAAGTSWSIKVVEPTNANCGDAGTLDAAAKEAGSCDFNS